MNHMRTVVVVLTIAVLCLSSLAAAPRGKRVQVSISAGRISPVSVTVAPGDTVVWVNADDRDHSIAADDGSFVSPKLKGGQSYAHTFAREGTYSYACTLHPREKGKIVVKK
jgi:plastocyanin